MIIKILSSAKNFAGIHYSERKNDLGLSELLKAENFSGLGHQPHPAKSDYVNYMKAICALNTRVKNKQFHAVISAKGKDYSTEQLAEIGVRYLESMGYGKNPYLIYHHSDTDNTHIHLVSTRVDKQGQKVDDAFEKIRSQKVLQEILLQDPKHEADVCVADALKYRFSTEAQFKLLLELHGFHLREKNVGGGGTNNLEIIKYGTVQKLFDAALIGKWMEEFELPAQRTKQLKALFHTYAVGLQEDKLSALMKEKFGLEVVFHRKSGMKKPYGYTVVDHTSKTVFKGSQLVRLADLLATSQDEKLKKLVLDLAGKSDTSFHDLQLELDKLGLKLNQTGIIMSPFGKLRLPSDLHSSLRYAERKALATAFKINDPSCNMVLAKLCFVKHQDIHPVLNSEKEFSAHKTAIAYLDQAKKWEEGLPYFKYHLLKNDHEVFLLSASDSSLMHLSKLMGRELDFPKDLVQNIQHFPAEKQEQVVNNTPRENLLELMLNMLTVSPQIPQDHKQRKRKSLKI